MDTTSSNPSSLPTRQTVMALSADGNFASAQQPFPDCPSGGAVIQLLAAGLCGSDVEKLARADQLAGSVLGHEITGRIAISDHPDWPVGTSIVTSHHVPCLTCQYCLNGNQSMCRAFKASNFTPGGFAPYFAITHGHLTHTAIRIPSGFPESAATAIEPLACVLKALRRGDSFTLNGEPKVMIVGLGFIGLLAAMALRQHYGDKITLIGVEKSEKRLTQLKDLKLNQLFNDCCTSETLPQREPAQVDQVFCSVLTPNIAAQAIQHIRDGGTIIQFSRGMGPQPTHFSANDLYYREISVIPSYSPNLEDLHRAGDLILTKQLDVQPLYTHQQPLHQLNEAVSLYRSGDAIKVWLTP